MRHDIHLSPRSRQFFSETAEMPSELLLQRRLLQEWNRLHQCFYLLGFTALVRGGRSIQRYTKER
jgi:hypothetical protein